MICATRSARFAILERGVGSARPAAVGGVEPDLADEAHEVQLAAFIFGDQHDRRAHRVASGHAGEAADGGVVEVDGEVGADQRLDARIGRFLEKLQPAEQVIGVRFGDSRRLFRLGVLEQRLHGDRAFARGAVNVGVDEADGVENRGLGTPN